MVFKFIVPKNVVAVARDAINDTNVLIGERGSRAFEREAVLAARVLADDKAKRKLRARIKELEDGLARACDLAIDAADVIADEELVDVEDEEDADFRRDIAEIRALVKRPEAKRHAARREAIAANAADETTQPEATS